MHTNDIFPQLPLDFVHIKFSLHENKRSRRNREWKSYTMNSAWLKPSIIPQNKYLIPNRPTFFSLQIIKHQLFSVPEQLRKSHPGNSKERPEWWKGGRAPNFPSSLPLAREVRVGNGGAPHFGSHAELRPSLIYGSPVKCIPANRERRSRGFSGLETSQLDLSSFFSFLYDSSRQRIIRPGVTGTGGINFMFGDKGWRVFTVFCDCK